MLRTIASPGRLSAIRLTRPLHTSLASKSNGDNGNTATVFPLSYVESSQKSQEPRESENNALFQNEQVAFQTAISSPSNATAALDWSTSFEGVGVSAFGKEVCEILMSPLADQDIEVKPDGLLYLPEIKYRRILNKAFGPGGWGMVPRGPHTVMGRVLTREYALIVNGRFVSQARGEQDHFSPEGLATATEGVKSNALMRCCKDLGIASELWDPVFIRLWKQANACEVWALDVKTNKKRKLWRRKDEKLNYPYQES